MREIILPVERQPDIGMRGGAVSAPFSFEVFLAASDDAVLRLLAHYNGYDRDSFDDFLVGGEQEVGRQLHEAASRQSTRFLHLLQMHWAKLSNRFRDDIMDGVADYTTGQPFYDKVQRERARWLDACRRGDP